MQACHIATFPILRLIFDRNLYTSLDTVVSFLAKILFSFLFSILYLCGKTFSHCGYYYFMDEVKLISVVGCGLAVATIANHSDIP